MRRFKRSEVASFSAFRRELGRLYGPGVARKTTLSVKAGVVSIRPDYGAGPCGPYCYGVGEFQKMLEVLRARTPLSGDRSNSEHVWRWRKREKRGGRRWEGESIKSLVAKSGG